MRLGDVASYINGFPFKPSDWSDMGVPIIRIQDLTGNGYQMNRFDGKYDAKYEVRAGDVLISWSASLGVYVWKLETAVLNQHIFKVRFDKVDVDKDFFVYQVECLLKKAARQAHGATMRHLTKPVFDGLPFYLPPKEEQKRIAVQLNAITHLISLRQRQAEKLDELVKARFVEMFGEGKYGGNPLSNVCKLITDGTHQPPQFVDAGIPFLLVSNLVHNEITYDTEKFISKESYQELIKRTPVEIGDILLSIVGSYGHAGVVRTDKPFCFQRHIAYIKPDFSKLNSEFLHHALLSDAVKYQMEKRVKGIAQKTLNLSELKKIVVPIPPLALQTEFSHFVHEVDREKERIQRSAALLETLKRSLMQQYFG